MASSSMQCWWLACMCLVSSLALCSSNKPAADRLMRLMIKSRQNSPIDEFNLLTASVEEFLHVEPQPSGLMEADKILRLPGQPPVGFNQYSGYVTVDTKAQRALFYYFVEAPQAADKKPLVLWLNGGPGCSSLAYGAMTELGPFRVNSDGQTLYENPFAWNKLANILFLESPASVGFSYSNTTSDYKKLGDRQTAQDAYAFLVSWLERYPQYKGRDFFLMGESFAGHYVPQLADFILRQNKGQRNGLNVNFKGIGIGNPWIDDATNQLGVFDYMLDHALISDDTHKNLLAHCLNSAVTISDDCDPYYNKAFGEEIGKINMYSIYSPRCDENATPKRENGSVNNFDPCSDNYVQSYMNIPEVQRALHVRPTNWKSCSDVNWTDWQHSILPTIKTLMENDLLVWIFSGDTDGVVPFTSSKYSIKTFNLSIEEAWRPWYSFNEVGGHVVKYKGLTFATVRGAGHEVPSYRPRESLTLFSAFVQGNPLPAQSPAN